jgi:hypothetical protein
LSTVLRRGTGPKTREEEQGSILGSGSGLNTDRGLILRRGEELSTGGVGERSRTEY